MSRPGSPAPRPISAEDFKDDDDAITEEDILAEVKASQPEPEKIAPSMIVPPAPELKFKTPPASERMTVSDTKEMLEEVMMDVTSEEMIWVRDEDPKAAKPFKLVPRTPVSVTNMVAPADRFDLTSDPFEIPKEYFEGKDGSYYSSMEFRWSSDDELKKGIAQRAGYSAVKEARGLKMTVKDGVASNGTMMLVHRPKDVGFEFDRHAEMERRMKQGKSTEEIEKTIDQNVRRMRGTAQSTGYSDNFDFFGDNFGEKETGGMRFAGGQNDTPEYDANEARNAARERGGRTFGGFDGRMGAKAVPESPYLRGR